MRIRWLSSCRREAMANNRLRLHKMIWIWPKSIGSFKTLHNSHTAYPNIPKKWTALYVEKRFAIRAKTTSWNDAFSVDILDSDSLTKWQKFLNTCATMCACARLFVFAHHQHYYFMTYAHTHKHIHISNRKRNEQMDGKIQCEWTTKEWQATATRKLEKIKTRNMESLFAHRCKLKAKLVQWIWVVSLSRGREVENVFTHASNIYTYVRLCEAWNMSNCCDCQGK